MCLQQLFQVSAICCLLVVARWIYRLTLHPLAKIPGPKLAAITSAYAMSWDMPKGSSYIKNFGKWHEKYGPVIRIEPNHVHILDIEAYNKVFKVGTKFYRDPVIYSFPFTKGGFFNKLHVKDAKPHRDLYMGYFSRSAVQSLEPIIQEHLAAFFTQFDQAATNNKPIDMTRAFRCLTADTLMRYSYDKPFGATSAPDFMDPMLEALSDFFNNSALGWYFPNLMAYVATAVKAAPRSWAAFDPGIAATLHNLDSCLARIVELKRDPPSQQTPSVFQTALHPNPDKGHPILSNADLAADALTIFTAGTDTTAHTLTSGTWHILQNPTVLQKLKAELRAAIPHATNLATMPLDWPQLEALPYLRSVIKECLRISSPVPGKLPRMVPPGGAELAGQFLPAGTAVSMAMHTYHNHPAAFPEPQRFWPERWLEDSHPRDEACLLLPPTTTKGGMAEAEKYLLPFSRGSRNCIGQNLAWAELYYCFAYLFRRFDLQGWDTRREDIEEWDDAFVVVTRGHLKVRARRVAE